MKDVSLPIINNFLANINLFSGLQNSLKNIVNTDKPLPRAMLGIFKQNKIQLTRSLTDLKSIQIKFNLFATGLSNQLTSRWIKHPHAFLRTGKPNNLFLIIRLNWPVIYCFYTNCINTVFGATDLEPKKTAPLCLPVQAMLCGYQIHLFSNYWNR